MINRGVDPLRDEFGKAMRVREGRANGRAKEDTERDERALFFVADGAIYSLSDILGVWRLTSEEPALVVMLKNGDNNTSVRVSGASAEVLDAWVLGHTLGADILFTEFERTGQGSDSFDPDEDSE